MTNPSKPTFFVSTPIYYVNAMPHLGTAYSTTACDTIARWKRMDGFDTFFLTGVDEHGQKVAESAEAHGMTPQAWVDSIAPGFQETWKALNISNDDFIRTTDERHVRGVQKFLQLLYDKGYLYKSSYEGWYCVHEETYYTESEVEEVDGVKVCPECKRPVQYEAAGRRTGSSSSPSSRTSCWPTTMSIPTSSAPIRVATRCSASCAVVSRTSP